MFDTESSWMQLFINTNRNGSNGWYGYDYIVNYSAKDEFTTTVAKNAIDIGKIVESVCGYCTVDEYQLINMLEEVLYHAN